MYSETTDLWEQDYKDINLALTYFALLFKSLLIHYFLCLKRKDGGTVYSMTNFGGRLIFVDSAMFKVC